MRNSSEPLHGNFCDTSRWWLLAGCIWLSCTLNAQTIALDYGFSGDGMDIITGGHHVMMQHVKVQADGKVIASGYDHSAGNDALVVRYTSTGELDPTFNDDGRFLIEGAQYAHMVLSGSHTVLALPSPQPTVMRLTSFGFPDNAFDQDGRVILSSAGYQTSNVGVSCYSDGRILAYSTAEELEFPYQRFALFWRMHSNGSLDQSFGTAGRMAVAIDRYGSIREARALPDGGVLGLANYEVVNNSYAQRLIRLTGQGMLDAAFGTNGIRDDQTGYYAYALEILPDGSIVIGGGYSEGFVARHLSDGSLDQTFSFDGIVHLPRTVQDLLIQPDGKILVTGTTLAGSGYWRRLNVNGTLDQGFGVSGVQSVDFPSGWTWEPLDLAWTQDWKIVSASTRSLSGAWVAVIARFHSGMDVGIEEHVAISSATIHPNPATASTQLTVEVVRSGAFNGTLYDMSGRALRTLFSSRLFTAGHHTVPIPMDDLGAGPYILVLESEGLVLRTPVIKQ